MINNVNENTTAYCASNFTLEKAFIAENRREIKLLIMLAYDKICYIESGKELKCENSLKNMRRCKMHVHCSYENAWN